MIKNFLELYFKKCLSPHSDNVREGMQETTREEKKHTGWQVQPVRDSRVPLASEVHFWGGKTCSVLNLWWDLKGKKNIRF